MRLAIAAVLAVSAGCYHEPATGKTLPLMRPPIMVAASSDALAYLPIDSEVVAVVEMRQLRASAVWKRFEPLILAKAGESLAEYRQACGYDPLAALRRVSIGLRGLDAAKPTGVIVIKGIERDATLTCVEKMRSVLPPGSSIDHDIVTVAGAHGDPPTVLTFVDPTTLVILVGPNANAVALGDVIHHGVPLRGSPAFVQLLNDIQLTDSLWFVINGSAKFLDKAAMLGFRPKAVTGSLNLSNGLVSAARLRLDSPAQADQIATMAQGQLQAVSTMVDEITVSADDSDVVLRLRMTQEQVETMIGLFGGILGGP